MSETIILDEKISLELQAKFYELKSKINNKETTTDEYCAYATILNEGTGGIPTK